MRADRLPAYGFQGVDTPVLDRIAAEGTIFEEAFAAAPLTLPSHASLFTGIYPPRLGVRDNAGAPLGSEFTTLAEFLRAQGLETAAFVASAVLAPGRGVEQGFGLYSGGDPARCASGRPSDPPSGRPGCRRRAVMVGASRWSGPSSRGSTCSTRTVLTICRLTTRTDTLILTWLRSRTRIPRSAG